MTIEEALEWADGYCSKDKERKAEVGTLAAEQEIRRLHEKFITEKYEGWTKAIERGNKLLERAEAAEQEVRNLHNDLKEAEGAVNDLMDKLTSIRSAALDAAAKVAREWNWRISADDICQDCSNVASEEIAAAIERLKEE